MFPSMLIVNYTHTQSNVNILGPLYKMVHYKMASDKTVYRCHLKVDPKKVVAKQKCIDYINKTVNLYIFVWIKSGPEVINFFHAQLN